MLEWLADISGMSLDWQELPGDYLNLTTQRSYTVAEVRDLINRHLLARGFTLLAPGRVLTVVKSRSSTRPGAARGAGGTRTARSARVRQGLVSLGLAVGRNGRAKNSSRC